MKSLKRARSLYSREVAWDIETVHWREIVSVCGVSSDGESVIAHSIPEYLEKARRKGWLTADTRHWAHYGGIFDHLLAWEHVAGTWILRDGKSGTGFGLWSADFVQKDVVWQLRDSARIMPQSLAAIGKAFGLEKIEVDRGAIHLLSQQETDSYCLRDCEVLLNAVMRFAEFVRGDGAVLRDTIASTAATIVRLSHLPADLWGWDAGLDAIAAEAYYGGRVERFRTELGPGRVYDINSSYPARMLLPLPTKHVATSERPRKGLWHFAHCTIRVPEDCYIPPLPYRGATRKELAGKLLFPVGEWSAYYTREEIELAQECGADVQYHTVWHYETAPFLAPLIERWWDVRKQSSDPAIKVITKLLMNSISGKLIEWGEYESVTENPHTADKAVSEGEKVRLYPVRTKSGEWVTYYGVSSRRSGVLRHAAAAASILAGARATLHRGMAEAQKTGTVAYCDTDSVLTDGILQESQELGRFKLEKTFDCAEFLAPKLYAYGGDNDITIRAKGFRIPRGRDPRDVWARLSFGAGLSYETSLGFKRLLGAKSTMYSRVSEYRQRRESLIDKRCFSGQDSRPWSIREIASRNEDEVGFT